MMMTALVAIAAGAAVRSVPDYGDVRLVGYYGDRFDRLVRNHVLANDPERLVVEYGQRRFREFKWQTEFWGKYMHSAMPVWKCTGNAELRRRIDASVDALIAFQETGGYLGDCDVSKRPDGKYDVWDIKYTMLGLLHYYDFAGEGNERGARALTAAKRLCDYLIDQFEGKGDSKLPLRACCQSVGQGSGSVLEPVVWLYKRTGEKRYLDFANTVVKELCEYDDGPRLLADADVPVGERCCKKAPAWCDWKPDLVLRKAYEQMSCYQGLIEYYEVTGRREYLDAAIKTAESIADTEVNVAGGASAGEFWYCGAKQQTRRVSMLQETCVLTTWMRLCEKLLVITGDPRWADELEKTFYNAYLASMTPDADVFAAYTPLSGYRSRGYHNCFMYTNCCNENGPRGYISILRALLQAGDDSAFMNLYLSGYSKIRLPKHGDEVEFYTYTTYPRENTVSIWYRSTTKRTFALKLRIPRFSAKTAVKLNGVRLDVDAKPGTYCEIRREWRNSDKIELVFDMPVKMHRLNEYVAFTRGPICLARDSRFNDGAMDDEIRAYQIKPENMASFKLVRSEDAQMFMVMSAVLPAGFHVEDTDNNFPPVIHFTDYASAGNKWCSDNRYSVWLPELIPGR